jgi:AcrR family transcriptional regulator
MALQIIDDDGANALTMRALAQRLDTGTTTLYRHFANRAELIAHVLDRVFGEVQLDLAELAATSWQRACQTAARATFETLRRHEHVVPLLVEQVPVGPNSMAQRERSIAFFLAHGFPPALAARAHATLSHYVLGFAMQLTTGQLDDATLAAAFDDIDSAAFPAISAAADSLPVTLEDEFAFGLELIISGLSQLLHNREPRKKS